MRHNFDRKKNIKYAQKNIFKKDQNKFVNTGIVKLNSNIMYQV